MLLKIPTYRKDFYKQICDFMRFIWTLSKSVCLREHLVPLGAIVFGKAMEPILGPKTRFPRLGQLYSSPRL